MDSSGCAALHLSVAGLGRVQTSWWARAHPMSASASASASDAVAVAVAVAVALAIAGRSPRSARGPWGAAGGGRSARRVGRRDAAKVFDRPGTACPKTPTDSREPGAQGCAKGADEGWPSLWLLSLTPGILPSAPTGPPSAFAPLLRRSGHARESDSGRPKDGPKALALQLLLLAPGVKWPAEQKPSRTVSTGSQRSLRPAPSPTPPPTGEGLTAIQVMGRGT